MVRGILLTGLLLLLIACQQTREPILLDETMARARAGEQDAMVRLVELLGSENLQLNDRIYAMLLELGEPVVPILLEQVSTTDPVRREHVVAALGNLKSTEAIPRLDRLLQNRALGRRYIAAWALGEIGTPAAVEPLLQALDDPQNEVRKHATRALIKTNRSAVAPLVSYLDGTPSLTGAAAAIRALGDIADPAALETLLRQLDTANRADAVTALGKLRDSRAVSALLGVLGDTSWQVRMNAAMALGPIAGEPEAPALEVLLEDDVNVVREWAARSLEMMTGRRYTYRNEDGVYVQPYNIYH